MRKRITLKPVWNKGLRVGSRPPLRVTDVAAIRKQLTDANRIRDLALFNLAIDSMLLPCELLRMRVEDIMPGGQLPERVDTVRVSTGRPFQFRMSEGTRASVRRYLAQSGRQASDFLFGGKRAGSCITVRQYMRLVTEWMVLAGLDAKVYSSHSIRRTKPFVVYEKTGNIYAVQKLLGHIMIKNTIHYLGLDTEGGVSAAVEVDI